MVTCLPLPPLYSFHNQLMLHSFDTLMQHIFRIPLLYPDLGTTDGRASIYFWRYIMNSAPCDFDACFKGMPDDMQAAKNGNHRSITGGIRITIAIIRQERRM